MSQGKLLGIATREKSRSVMVPIDHADITLEEGVVGDFRGRPGPRQVTVLSREAWEDACADLGRELPWTIRRANLFVDGIDLHQTTGSVIKVGDVELQVCGETDPCERMEQQVAGLRESLSPHWRGGVCCRVVSGGLLQIGDSVVLETS